MLLAIFSPFHKYISKPRYPAMAAESQGVPSPVEGGDAGRTPLPGVMCNGCWVTKPFSSPRASAQGWEDAGTPVPAPSILPTAVTSAVSTFVGEAGSVQHWQHHGLSTGSKSQKGMWVSHQEINFSTMSFELFESLSLLSYSAPPGPPCAFSPDKPGGEEPTAPLQGDRVVGAVGLGESIPRGSKSANK